MTRDEAYKIVTSLIKNENLIKHHLAAEAAMKEIYTWIQKSRQEAIDLAEQEKWGLVGLLHDADYELSKDHPQKHTLILEEKYKDKIPPDIMYAIKAHNYKYSGANPVSFMDWAICCCDELTGLIVAAALVHPSRKLANLDEKFIENRFNEKSFAKGAERESIKMCEEHLGIPLDDFIYVVLTAMQKIAPSLGL